MRGFILLVLLACDPTTTDSDKPGESVPDGDSDSHTDTETDTDSDTHDSVPHSGDTDTDTDTHSDSDSDTHSGSDSDTDETGVPTTDPPMVILFIGDGMGREHVAGGGVYATGAAGSLNMETLPYQGRIRSASLSGITDSAAAATTYASGYKTYNGKLGLDGDGTEVENLVEVAKGRGMGTGIVTTDTVTGATPAGFMVHVRGRGDTEEIATQEVESPPDVLLGGGQESVEPLVDTTTIQLVTDGPGLDAAVSDGRPLFGLFAATTLPWVAEGYGEIPTLETMTKKALDWLDDDPEGFFMMVEGARIDHASHGQHEDYVHAETKAFDDAIAAAMSWAESHDNVTIIVTADHECGGMTVAHSGTAGEVPETTWRWGKHTNADPWVFATGPKTSFIDDQRLDSRWVYETLYASITETDVATPDSILLPDGWFEDLGDADTVQTLDTDFGTGFNQLDGLVATADEDGLWLGLSGVFERDKNAVVLLLDVDYGEGTGLGGDGSALPDTDGALEVTLSNLSLDVGVDGLGFDLALVSAGGYEQDVEDLGEDAGLRGLRDPWAYDGDLWWLNAAINVDDGNVAVDGVEATDAGATGATEGGLEFWVPWDVIYPDERPGVAMQVAVVAVLVDSTGAFASDQVLPPLEEEPVSSSDPIAITRALVLDVDDVGAIVGDPEVVDGS